MTPSNASTKFVKLGIGLSLAIIASLTLFPSSEPAAPVPGLCLICGDRGVADFILNTVLFMPLGAALALFGTPARTVLLLCATVSAAIELSQVMIPGRTATVGDLFANTAGGGVGLALAYLVTRSTNHVLFRRIGPGLPAFIAAVALALTAFLLTPAYPGSTYFGQWTPRVAHLDPYHGRILAAHLGDVEIINGRLPDSRRAMEALFADKPITIRMIAGPPTQHLASLVSIADDREQEVMLLGADRHDLVLRRALRAVRYRLDRPDVRAPGLLVGVHVGDTVEVRFSAEDTTHCLAAHGRSMCGLGHTPAMGWTLLLYPEHIPQWTRRSLSALWLAILTLPVGFLSRSRFDWVAASAAVALALAAASYAPTMSLPGIVEWTGIVIGAASGRAAKIYLRHRRPPADSPVPAPTTAPDINR